MLVAIDLCIDAFSKMNLNLGKTLQKWPNISYEVIFANFIMFSSIYTNKNLEA